MAEKIYYLGPDQEPKPMEETAFDRESDLQELLAAHPQLLDGEQMRPGDPLRWMLISCEVGIADAPESATRWSVDHLLLDQEGLPTLVEVKRGQDTRVRREVVGQMLDYAAHASATWSPGRVRQMFDERTAYADAEEELRELLDPNRALHDGAFAREIEELWSKVSSNLAAGNLRLLFVADAVPDELARVVGFLNRHMDIEVLAVELKQFEGGANRTVVPRVIGRLAKARPPTDRRRPLSNEEFLARFDQDTQAVVRRLLDTALKHRATFSGQWRLSIQATCPAWRNRITVGWLTPPGDAGDPPQNANYFVFGIFQRNGIEELPEALSDRLRRWASLFHSRETFVPVDDPWNNKNPKDYGFIPCYAVTHADAAQDINFLTQELASVLDDIAKIRDD